MLSTLFPWIVIALCTLAGIIYLFSGKYGSATFWLAAATVNFAVVYLIPKLG